MHLLGLRLRYLLELRRLFGPPCARNGPLPGNTHKVSQQLLRRSFARSCGAGQRRLTVGRCALGVEFAYLSSGGT